MSELVVGSIAGLASNNYVVDIASGSQLTQPGMVLQVVQGTTTTSTTINTTSLTDTTLEASITPSSTSSKILVIFSQNVRVDRASFANGANFSLLRNATEIVDLANTGTTYYLRAATVSDFDLRGFLSFNYLDSPASTSLLTYKTQASVQNTADSGFVQVQTDNIMSTMILMEIAG